MTAAIPRPPAAYVHGLDGPAVVVPGRVAAWLQRHVDLRRVRVEHRGGDPEVDAVLVALALAAAAWRSSRGTEVAPEPEPERRSRLTTTEAAGLLGLTERGVRAACAAGRLPAERHADRWVICREDVEHYGAAHRAG